MFNIILVVILLVVGVGLYLTRKGAARFLAVIPVLLAVFVLVGSLVRVINATEVGIPTTLGKIGSPLRPGLHLVTPWTTVETFSTRIQESDMTQVASEGDRSRADGIEVLSKEGGRMILDVTVRYRVNVSKADELYKRVGTMELLRDRIVRPDTRSKIRDVYTKYTAEEAYSTKRAEVAAEAAKVLRDSLAPQFVDLDALLIRDIQLEAKLQEQITRKLEARQEVERASIEQERQQTEAETRRRVAETDAKSRVAAALGEAEANKIIAESLTPEVLRAREIDAIAGNGNTVFFPYGQPITPLVQTPGGTRTTSSGSTATSPTTEPSTVATPTTVAG